MTSFRFKQFVVRQDLSPMKVGTDGVLLGAWATVRASDRRMLDIGTGTGLIALMLAQRAPQARIEGIDIEEVAEARANADASPWGERIEMVQESAQTFSLGGRFDLVVSNPPFFDGSLPCPDVRTTPRRPAKRVLLEFTPAGAGPAPVPERTELTVGTGEHECYTPEYRALTRDFYLRF